MTDETNQTIPDPRPALETVVEAVGDLVTATESLPAETLSAGTPCPDFSVADLLDHLVMVVRRIAVVGNGGHFATIEQESLGSEWSSAYRDAANEVTEAWSDTAKLGQTFQVPWGEFPGAPILLSYIGELATHGWDLGQSIGQPFAVDDDVLQGALMAIKFVPAEGRESGEIPFGPVVDPGPQASAVEQIAGWLGRKVI